MSNNDEDQQQQQHVTGLALLEMRLGMLETSFESFSKQANGKLDKLLQDYPSLAMLDLYLKPIVDDVRELKEDKISKTAALQAKDAQDDVFRKQTKVNIVLAALGPTMMFITAAVVYYLASGAAG